MIGRSEGAAGREVTEGVAREAEEAGGEATRVEFDGIGAMELVGVCEARGEFVNDSVPVADERLCVSSKTVTVEESP